jgi:hypothetical protein
MLHNLHACFPHYKAGVTADKGNETDGCVTTNSVALVRERTIMIERPPLVGG